MHPIELSRPFHHAGWVYEEKVDGWRMVATKAADSVRLISRNGLDHTRRFAELVKALTTLKPATFTLDGEMAVYDQAFISRFEWLRVRPKDEPSTLPVYMVFDVLELGGRDLRGETLKERRRALERLLGGHGMIFPDGCRSSGGRMVGRCPRCRRRPRCPLIPSQRCGPSHDAQPFT